MCEQNTHRRFGVTTGILFGAALGASLPAIAGLAAIGWATAGGAASPDVDQHFDIHRGPLKHRGITHSWMIPAVAWYLTRPDLNTLGGVLVAGVILGWVSHLIADFVVGAKGWGRDAGIPFLFHWAHFGLGFKNEGVVETILSALLPFINCAFGAYTVYLVIPPTMLGG